MFDLEKVKGIIFDYGGTIDTNGRHWAEVIWEGYQALGVNISKEVFREAYVAAERALATEKLIEPDFPFLDTISLKINEQFIWLNTNGHIKIKEVGLRKVNDIAVYCEKLAQECIKEAYPVLEQLDKKYPMVLVTNFYGNMHTVLKGYKLDSYFKTVVESAVVGVRKPDPQIFRLGVEALELQPEEIVVIGDSYKKDIVPAQGIGCQTVWLKNTGWEPYKGDETADAIISDFQELKSLFNL